MMYKYDTTAPEYMHDDSNSSSTSSPNATADISHADLDAYTKEGKVVGEIVLLMWTSIFETLDQLVTTPDILKQFCWYQSFEMRQEELWQLCEKTAEFGMCEKLRPLVRLYGLTLRFRDSFMRTVERLETEYATGETSEEDEGDGEEDKGEEEDEGEEVDGVDEGDEGDEEEEGDDGDDLGDRVDGGDDQISDGSSYQFVEYSSDEWESVSDEDPTEESRSSQPSAAYDGLLGPDD